MDINDANLKEPRYQRHARSKKSPAHSSAQAQPVSDSQSGSAKNTSGALFDSARNMLIGGGQFTAAANVNRNVTINISEGITPQIQTESNHSRQTTNRSRNRRRAPMRPQQAPTGRVQRSNQIYERLLGEKARGHPLWIPQPNMVLPIPYRAHGVRVGDVGIFTDDGGFDFLFNICASRDDPINPEELPENFVPIYPSINPIDIRKFAEFCPGSYLASSSVTESRTAEQSSGLIFESSAAEGAILTMPEGAYSENLSSISRVEKYIGSHAKNWYKFVNGPRDREAQNGDLRVVVGSDKTTSWGMATFTNSSLSQDKNFRLKFSAYGHEEQLSQRNVGNNYAWEHSGVAEVRVGPGRGENEELGETDSNRLRNQCLFLRTLQVMLSEKVWGEIFPQTISVAADQNNSHSGIQDQSTPCPHGSSTGHEDAQPSMSRSSQNLPFRSHKSTATSTSSDFTQYPANYGNFNLNDLVDPNLMELLFGNLYSYDVVDEVPCSPSMSQHEENVLGSGFKIALASQLAAEEETNSQISSNTPLNLSGYEETQCDSTVMPDVILTRSSSCNRGLHPSKIISQYLLEQVPHAVVAVTHDKDWSSIIGMDLCHSDPSQLLSVVRSRYDIVVDNDTSLVSLELKEQDQNGMLSEEEKVAELIKSIKNSELTLDQYLFGFHTDRCLHLQELCNALRSGETNQPTLMSSFLIGHPERPLSLDELLKIWNVDFHVQGSTQRQSIVALRAELSLFPSEHTDRSSRLLRLADALCRRFSQWAQKDDLEEAIWSYEEALSLIPNSHYQYLETLLGLCSSLYQRFYLLGHTDDLENLLRYLDLQCDVLKRRHLLLAPVEVQLEKFHRDSGSTEEGPGPGPSEHTWTKNPVQKPHSESNVEVISKQTNPRKRLADLSVTGDPRSRGIYNSSCDVCARKKIKCDGIKPVCQLCQSQGRQQECTWTKDPVRKLRAEPRFEAVHKKTGHIGKRPAELRQCNIPYQYTIPDLLANWPWKRLLNPMLAEVKDEANAWVESLALFDSAQLQKFNACDFNLLGALIGPLKSKEHLRITCDLVNFYFTLEEYTNLTSKAEARKLFNDVMNAFRRREASVLPSHSKLAEMAQQFFERTVNVVGEDIPAVERFISDFDDHTKSIMLEAEARVAGHLRSVNDYVILRRDTCAAKPTFSFLGLGLNIPDAVFAHPLMISLTENATDLIAITNDMHSYCLDRSRGLDGHNIITAIMQEYQLDLQQALYWLSGYASKAISNFLSNSRSLPSWGEKIDQAVRVYIDRLGRCVRGYDSWSYETNRYYGEDGLKVQECRKITLLPPDSGYFTRDELELGVVAA